MLCWGHASLGWPLSPFLVAGQLPEGRAPPPCGSDLHPEPGPLLITLVIYDLFGVNGWKSVPEPVV